jgi:hypothetical protein
VNAPRLLTPTDWMEVYSLVAPYGFVRVHPERFRHIRDAVETFMELGYTFQIAVPLKNFDDIYAGFDAIMAVADGEHVMEPWTQGVAENGFVYAFRREEDAVLFRLLLN